MVDTTTCGHPSCIIHHIIYNCCPEPSIPEKYGIITKIMFIVSPKVGHHTFLGANTVSDAVFLFLRMAGRSFFKGAPNHKPPTQIQMLAAWYYICGPMV